ncbi:MAG TPA: hypothetical protein VLI39_06805 [Sedimentisphaerales bacterium]|nr:hypothetical protein [Sedimentisphaerales bacterium]
MQMVEVTKQSILANLHCRHNRGGAVLRVLVVKPHRPTENTRVL